MSLNESQPHQEPSEIRCRRCKATPRLAHKILNARNGGTLRMYKCECGEQMWIERPQ
jgi:hypothetical protein